MSDSPDSVQMGRAETPRMSRASLAVWWLISLILAFSWGATLVRHYADIRECAVRFSYAPTASDSLRIVAVHRCEIRQPTPERP